MKIKQWIEAYEAGQEVESVEMGGLGEGYENCIQSLAIEISRSLPDFPEDDIEKANEIINKVYDDSAKRLNPVHHFSGAQAGAAKHIAWHVWGDGTESFQQVRDRIIKIKKVDGERAAVVNYVLK